MSQKNRSFLNTHTQTNEISEYEYIFLKKIKIRKGYKFNKISNVFDDYVKTIYKEKNENLASKRLIAKLLLNALLGPIIHKYILC